MLGLVMPQENFTGSFTSNLHVCICMCLSPPSPSMSLKAPSSLAMRRLKHFRRWPEVEGCSLGRGTVCEEMVVGSTAGAVSSSYSQGSPDCQLKWPRSACELLGWTGGVWAGERRPGSEKGEHPRQPECRGSGGLWLSVKRLRRWEALTEAGVGGGVITR